MMTILQNNTFSRDNLSVGDNGVRNIHYGDVLIKYGAVLDLHSENVPVINAEQDISKFSALSLLMAIKKYIERARVNALLTTNIYTEIA